MSDIFPLAGQISGLEIKNLKRIPDERGTIYHCAKASELEFTIREVYFKKLFSGVVNGWHVHETMTLCYTTFFGMTKLVLVDLRKNSETYQNMQELYCGEDNYCRVTIPPGVANASQCVSDGFSIFVNTPDKEHDPKLKYKRIDPFNGCIKYKWFEKHY
jgi:dTDP-4-dehydrorhamnose 3,5-epimerase